jgi:hypothetical protein
MVGGSTYSFDVWSGHPLESEVKVQLGEMRYRCGELRRRVEAHNAMAGLPREYQQIIFYSGQCILEREIESDHGGSKDDR